MTETVRTDVVISAIDKASGPLKRITGGFNMLSKQGLMAGVAFAGVTMGLQALMQGFQMLQQYMGASVSAFREFSKTMSEVATMLDDIGMTLLPDMTTQINLMSIAFGKSANDLGRGLYQVLSAGVDASKAMMVLRNSAKLASATLTSVETSVDAVTTVLNAYDMSAYRSAEVTNIFAKTIIEGKVRMEELAAAIGYVVPIAAQAGIEFEEVAAAIATLSKQGIKAQKASRGLRQLFTQLLNPSEEAISAMVDMGIAYDELIIEGMGLGNVMQMINTATGGSVAEMSRLIPVTQALSAGLAMNAQDGDLFTDTLKEINSELNAVNEMYDKISKSPAFIAEQNKMIAESTKRLTGEALEPGAKAMEDFQNAFQLGVTKLSPGDALLALFTPAAAVADILKKGYKELDEINKKSKEIADDESLKNYTEKETAEFEKLNDILDKSNSIIHDTTIAMSKIVDVEIPHLKELQRISTETYAYNTSLRFLNAALKDSRYNSYLHESSTRSLVDTIRGYKDELEALDAVQRSYNRETSVNSIAMMKIQLDADKRRGRLNRGQRNQMEELQRANDQLRINTAENALAMADIQEELSPAEKELELVRLAYQEQLFIIQDTYAQEQKALQDQIDYKELLYGKYEDIIRTHYGRVEQATSTHMSAMSALFANSPAAYQGVMFNLNPGVMGPFAPPASGGGGGGNVHVDPITINVNNNMTPEQLAQALERGLQSGILAGFTTSYR